MSYYNFNLAMQKHISPKDVILLQLIKQNKAEELSALIAMVMCDETLEALEGDDIVYYVKGTKKQTQFEKIRLTKKGDKLLSDISDTYKVEEQDIVVFDWLKNLYLQNDKEIGSETKCKNLIAWFRLESGISKNHLILLCKKFTSDEDRMEYSKVLQYVFWRGENHFQTKPKLEDSKLWLYYEKHRDYFNREFEKLDKNE